MKKKTKKPLLNLTHNVFRFYFFGQLSFRTLTVLVSLLIDLPNHSISITALWDHNWWTCLLTCQFFNIINDKPWCMSLAGRSRVTQGQYEISAWPGPIFSKMELICNLRGYLQKKLVAQILKSSTHLYPSTRRVRADVYQELSKMKLNSFGKLLSKMVKLWWIFLSLTFFPYP